MTFSNFELFWEEDDDAFIKKIQIFNVKVPQDEANICLKAGTSGGIGLG